MMNAPNIVLLLTLALVLLSVISICDYALLAPSPAWKSSSSSSSSSSTSSPSSLSVLSKDGASDIRRKNVRFPKKCDVFKGEWVPDSNAPYYTNKTCQVIHEQLNCVKYGRPDTSFMKWRWKPEGCELPIFNPAQFLEHVRGKSLAFVGDSLGRNQMESLMCLLSTVTYAVDAYPQPDEKFGSWFYPDYNFTVANYWSPYLVRAVEAETIGLIKLYLDEPDANWTSHASLFDYVVVSAGHWFLRPSMYYESRRLVGCHHCLAPDVTDLTHYYGYRRAFRTAFHVLNAMEDYKGMTILRTFSPSHFENGQWNNGGDCVRTRPLRSNETRLEGNNLEMYMMQVQEFRAAEQEAMRKGRKYRLLDATEAMLLRPDGHPRMYGHRPEDQKKIMHSDCLHWCLPGPVDVWNDFLLQILKMEDRMQGMY